MLAAAEAGDVEADAAICFGHALCVNAEVEALSNSAVAELERAEASLLAKFEPQRDAVEYWIPRHACHQVATWAYALARAWRPDGDWRLLSSTVHSTVVDVVSGSVFDLLLFVRLWLQPNGDLAFSCEVCPKSETEV